MHRPNYQNLAFPEQKTNETATLIKQQQQEILQLQQQKLEFLALISRLKQENIAIEASKIQQKSIFDGKLQQLNDEIIKITEASEAFQNQLFNAESEIEKLKFQLQNFDQISAEKLNLQQGSARLFAEKLSLQTENQRLQKKLKQQENKVKSVEKEWKIEKQIALELDQNVEEMEKYVNLQVQEVKKELEAYYEAGKSSLKRRIIELEKRLAEKKCV